jgi:hypothetical protein
MSFQQTKSIDRESYFLCLRWGRLLTPKQMKIFLSIGAQYNDEQKAFVTRNRSGVIPHIQQLPTLDSG